jgi:SulP family sulfate permease
MDGEQSMTAGTLAGELSALSGTPRNATVVAERASVIWKMSAESYERLEREQSVIAKAFVTLVLKGAWVGMGSRWGADMITCSCKARL